MADKKTSKNSINNDFDIDSNFEFDGFNFDDPVVKDDRKPIIRAATAAAKGAKTIHRDSSFVKKTLKAALPKGFGQSLDTSDKVASTIRNLYDESAKEVKPAWREFKRNSLKLVPPDSKLVPRPLQKMFKRMRDEIADEDRYAASGNTDRRELEIASMLAQTTEAQMQHTISVEAERLGRDRLKEGMELHRHRDIMTMITGTAVSADKIQKFQTNITLPVQKKMLELQMRTLFTLQDTIAFMKEDAQKRDAYLAAISKNTMLPDTVKMNSKEAKEAVARNAWNQSIQRGLFGGRDQMIEKTLGHFSNMVLNQAKGLAEGLGAGASLADQGADAGEMMRGQDGYAMGGETAGKFAGQKIAGWGAGKVKKALSSGRMDRFGGKKVLGMGHRLEDLNENAMHKLNDFRRSDKYLFDDSLKGGFMRIMQGLLPNTGPDMGIKSDNARDLDSPMMGTKRVNRSITEVIPGYLARLLREAQMARLGKNVELTTYNWASNKFSSRSRLEADVFKGIINSKAASRTQAQLDDLINQMDPDGTKLSPEARKVLKKKLLTNSTNMREASRENLGDARGYQGVNGSVVNEVTGAVNDFFNNLPADRKATFSRAHNSLATSMADPREAIQRQADWGNMAYLKKMGFLTEDGKNVDMSKIIDYVIDPSNAETVRKMAEDPQGAKMSDTLKSHFNAAKEQAKSGFSQASAYAKDSYSKFSQMTPQQMAQATREGGMSLVSKAKTMAKDVYVAGEASPRLQGIKLTMGQYRDRLTKKVITTLDQIKGEVEDVSDGSVVVLAKDLPRLTYVAPDGQSMQPLNVQPLREAFGIGPGGVPTNIRDLTAMIRQQGQSILTNSQAGPSDVYVAGESKPRLIAAKMEAGAYSDAETGKPIRHETDIEGDVRDEDGQTVIEAMELPKLRVVDRRTGIMKPITFVAKVAMAIAKGTWWWQKKMWAWTKWNLKTLKAATMGAVGIVKRVFGDPPRDVFVKGEAKPRLYAARMLAGDYRDLETGERIKHQSEIKGAVIDRDDQIVLEENELDRLQVYNNVLRIFNPFKLVKWVGKKIGQGAWWLTKKIQKGGMALSKAMFKGMGKTISFLTARARDVFVKGERKPRLTAGLMKAGAYILEKTGKVINTVDDITGAVQTEIDGKMGTILSEDEFMRGLYGEDGKLLKGGVMATIGKGLGQLNRLMSMRTKLQTGVREQSTKDILKSKVATAGDKTVVLLQDIKSIFQKRFGDSADTDGDGMRDGSWQSLLKRKKDGAAGAASAADKKDKEGGGLLGGLKSLLGFGKKKGDEDDDGYGLRDGLEDAANADELLDGDGRRRPRGRGKAGRLSRMFRGMGGARGLLRGAGAGAVMAAGAYGVDGLMGKAGVGKNAGVNTAVDDANWDKMSLGEKLQSGAGRAVEGAGGLLFMDNIAAEARKKRVDNETGYLQEKASGRTPSKGVLDYLMMGNPVNLALGLATGVLGGGGFKNTAYDQIRYVQYGFDAKNTDGAAKASAMEDYLMKFVKGGDPISIDESKMDVDRLMKPWGLNPSDSKQMQQFFGWYKNRFKPVFLVHLNAIKRFTGSADLSGVGSIKKEQASSYVDAIRYSGGPYDYLQMPIESLAGTSSYAVTAAVEKAISDMGIKPGDAKSAAAGAAAATTVGAAAAGAAVDVPKTKTDTFNDLFKSALGIGKDDKSKIEQFASTLGKADITQSGDVNALDAVRFRVYGLQQMDPGKVLSLRTLERVLQPDLKFQGDGKATWNGSIPNILSKVQGAFGVSNAMDIDGQAWSNWFRQRFLPTYLAYMSSYRSLTGKTEAAMADVMIKPGDKVQVAKMLIGLSGVWDFGQSPWPGYTLSNNDKDAKNNIDFLEKKGKEAALQEQKATTASSSTSSSSSSDQSWWSKSTSAVKDFFSFGKKDDNTKLPAVTSPDAEAPSKGTSGVSPVAVGGGKSGIGAPPVAGGQLADGRNADAFLSLKSGVTLDGMHPEFMKNFKGMVEEYGNLTGKKINVNDAFRSYQDQVAAKKKYGNRAASPGNSLHEFGLAMDIDKAVLDDLDKMGLMRKYGFTRPVGGEGWHMEPIGIQADIAKYKKDQNAAAQAIASGIGRGGGGFGTIDGAAKYSRNKELSQSIYESTAGQKVDNTKQASDSLKAPNAPGSDTVAGSVGAPPAVSAVPSGGRLGVDGAGGAQFDGEAKPQGGGGAGNSGIANGAPARNALPADPTVKVPDPKGSGYQGMKDTIIAAAKMVGVDPDMMIRMAAIESSFNPSAQAGTSSASGLFQFTRDTWRAMIDKYGRKYGFDISTQPTDPKAASILAAHLVKDSEKQVAPKINRPFGSTEAYIAHFLGPGGAVTLLKALDKSPGASAAEIMPKAASANRSIFYDGNRPRTVQEVYALLNNKVNSKIAQFGVPNVAKSNAALAASAGGDSKSVDGPSMATGVPPPAPTGAQPTSMASVPSAAASPASMPSGPGATESAPMSDAFGIRPQQVQQRSTPQGQPMQMDPSVFAPTNDILTQQLVVQQKMLTTLESILAAASAGGGAAPAESAGAGSVPPSRAPYNVPKPAVPMRRKALT